MITMGGFIVELQKHPPTESNRSHLETTEPIKYATT
jgi:hypothetical protein